MVGRMGGPSGERPAASVVICAYTDRRFEVLQAAQTAVLGQLHAADELLIVVDHNEQLLARAAQTFATGNGHVRVIANDGLRGLSGARNTGVRAARNQVVAFLDDDAVPESRWLEELVAPFDDEAVIATGGTASPSWEQQRPSWFPDEFLWVVGCSYRGLPESSAEIRNPIGANMAFRRDVIKRVGGFTDGIGRVGRTPLGCEETELSIRATRATGGRILLEPAATVRHLVTGERARVSYFLRRCWAEGISKAVISRLVGSDAALASERSYATRTLPAGLLTAIRDGIRGDRGGFGRAGAIAGGLLVTALGYLRGSFARSAATRPTVENTSSAGFTPIWSGELEVTEPRLPARLLGEGGGPLSRARLLVRAQGTPVGFIELAAPNGVISAELAAATARERFGAEVAKAQQDSGWLSAARTRVSVVLCTHRRPEGARRTIESVLALNYADFELIVVDNAPSDESTKAVVDGFAAKDSRVRYVKEPIKGLSRARNRGLAEATGELIAFTDDDVRVDPLWLHGVLRGFRREAGVACVTGLVATSSLEHPAEQYFDSRVWWSSSCEQRIFRPERGPQDPALHPYSSGRFGTGANFAAKTDVLRSVAGFDECLGAGSLTRGGEDLDLFVRLIRSGHSLSFEPSALVWHDHRVDDASLREQMYAYGLGLTGYLTKHMLIRETRNELLGRALDGLVHAVRLSRRAGDAGATSGLGGGLRGVERKGMLHGPWAYMRARRGEARAGRRL